MKHLLLLIGIALLFTACSETEEPNLVFKSHGVIVSPADATADCGSPGVDCNGDCYALCCGGWFIEIEGKTYHFFSLPATSNINLPETQLPIPVKLSWSKRACTSNIKTITIHSIERE